MDTMTHFKKDMKMCMVNLKNNLKLWLIDLRNKFIDFKRDDLIMNWPDAASTGRSYFVCRSCARKGMKIDYLEGGKERETLQRLLDKAEKAVPYEE